MGTGLPGFGKLGGWSCRGIAVAVPGASTDAGSAVRVVP